MSNPSKQYNEVTFTVLGEPASKANSRRQVRNKKTGRVAFIKSKKALDYEKTFAAQCPALNPMLEGDLSASIVIYYASRRPDLDSSLIEDCMQATYEYKIEGSGKKKTKHLIRGAIYTNDRQIKVKKLYWQLDRKNPRAEITVKEIPTVTDSTRDSDD